MAAPPAPSLPTTSSTASPRCPAPTGVVGEEAVEVPGAGSGSPAGPSARGCGKGIPELWLLGSSDVSAGYAAELGWSFCYAHFINPERADTAFEAYRKLFVPSPIAAAPRPSIAVSALVAETEEDAERLSWSRWGWRLMGGAGGPGIPPVEDALAFAYTEPEREYIEMMKSRSLHGTPEQVRDRLLAMGERHGLDEFVIVTITYDFASRLRSYELLAEAFGLEPRR